MDRCERIILLVKFAFYFHLYHIASMTTAMCETYFTERLLEYHFKFTIHSDNLINRPLLYSYINKTVNDAFHPSTPVASLHHRLLAESLSMVDDDVSYHQK